MLKKILIKLIFFVFVFNNILLSQDIPIIVIAPSKKPQSASTVGTSVVVLDEEFLKKSNEFFLGDVLSSSTTSANFFQNGGHGSTSAIQLRGLPKRYSTVYIDGVKMSDPSSVSGDFDFNHILTSQISRVEILKGNQSSVYGSGAIGGTINITTKKGKPGRQKNTMVNTGSHGTTNYSASYSGSDDDKNFYLGFERFQTEGMSAMTHNDEKDGYKNNSLVANYSQNLSNELRFKSNLRFSDTYKQYDKEVDTSTATHNEEEDSIQSSANLMLEYEHNKKFISEASLSQTYIKRIYNAAPGSGNTIKDNYYGDRYNYGYKGIYNFDLDNSIIFGIEREDDQIGYNKDLTGKKVESFYTTSTYLDYQKRFTENIFATFGSRFDDNSIAGDEEAHRFTFAYLFDDKSTKIKSSYGTGFRFPSLYEMYYVYAANSNSLPFVKAENSESFDVGIEKSFSKYGLNFDLTYFNIKYDNVLEGWKDNNSSGAAYTTQNADGIVKSQGLELMSGWRASDNLNLNLNYTYTSTYDGAEQDDPNANQNYTNKQMVRVPRNIINLQTNFQSPNDKNLSFKLNSKWSDMARDYGNGNRTYSDERLDDYFVNDFSINYKIWESYNLFFNITNVFDEKYETVRDYSQLDRSFNIGLKSIY
tara:strand:+ start:568 stop:2502 length:1935 start_codon:yes stop_codon:yes gene_type:complete